MNQLTKCSSGLLFKEEFGENIGLVWDLAPNELGRIELTNDSLKILPGDSRLELTMPCPQQSGWVFQTHVKYSPRTTTESGGFLLKSITDNIAECELKGDNRDLYSYMKMELSNDYIFSLKASKDGTTWRDFGNSKMLDGNKFGYYLNEATQYDALEIYNCLVYKGNFITITNLPSNILVDVYDENGNRITNKFIIAYYDHHVVLDCTNVLFPISYFSITVKNMDGEEIFQWYATDVYGGDTYSISYNVKFTINGKNVDDDFYDMGTVAGIYGLYSLVITNLDGYDLINKTLSISAFSSYNPGNLPVTIAEATTIDQTTDLEFKKELKLSFKPYEAKSFYIKIDRDNTLVISDSEYRFKVLLL